MRFRGAPTFKALSQKSIARCERGDPYDHLADRVCRTTRRRASLAIADAVSRFDTLSRGRHTSAPRIYS